MVGARAMVSSVSLSFFNIATAQSGTGQLGLGADMIGAWAASRVPAATSLNPTADPAAPFAPWEPGYPMPGDNLLALAAFQGGEFFDLANARFADPTVDGDYARLFAMHTGLRTLYAVAGGLEDPKITGAQRAKLIATFERGQAELAAFLQTQQFEGVRLTAGQRVDSGETKLGIAVATEDYQTAAFHRGRLTTLIPNLDPNATFEIVAQTSVGATKHVAIDLAEMGSIPRSLGAVVSFINGRLAVEGVQTRLEAVSTSPKTTTVIVGGQSVERPFTGTPTYALKIDVRAGEKISFAAADADPAFYVVGQTSAGGRLIKLQDVMGAPGEPALQARPGATQNPLGAANGYLGAGGPYGAAPAQSWEFISGKLIDETGDTSVEPLLAEPGDAVLNLTLADGRKLTITAGWQSEASEAWRIRDGESEELGRLDDLSERLSQLLHEQGIAAGLDVWTDGDGGAGLSVYAGDQIRIDGLTIGGRSIALEAGRDPAGGLDAGLRAGIFARRFETASLGAPGQTFTGAHTITLNNAGAALNFVIDGGEDGIDSVAFAAALNEQFADRGVRARAALVDQGGALVLQIDTLHETTAVSARFDDTTQTLVLRAPGAWADGGLPAAGAGEPFGDARRTYAAQGASPLTLPGNEGALELAITIATPTGPRIVSLSITAQERADNPDIGPGQWNAALQARLDAALNEAGVYAASDSLNDFTIAEGSGQRLQSVTLNGQTVDYEAASPGIGGAFGEVRSSSSAALAAATDDEIAALIATPSASVTLKTVWGDALITADLEGADPRDLDSVALRLNEALAAAGYDARVEAANVDGGAGLRVITGESFTVSNVAALSVGGQSVAVTLDAIDAAARGDDPIGAADVAARASRGAAALLTIPTTSSSAHVAPSNLNANWFAGRAFDVSLGDGAKVLAARATAAAPDGSIYVLADVENLVGAQPIKGTRDVALLKYDSAGTLLYSRALGAADEAQGFSLAVAADGRVAIAGAVTGALSGAAADKGKSDSFVTMFDASGIEQWTARRGTTGEDEVSALAFAADGALIATGRVQGAFGAQTSAGAYDAYVRGYSAGGAELFTRQFGTGADDSATALVLRDSGGGVEITTGGVENGRGVLRQFTYSAAGGLTIGDTRDIGAFGTGAGIASLAIDGAAIYVGGAVRADKLELGAPARAAVGLLEGFVARVSTDLGSVALDRATYLGSSKDDGVSAVTIVDGVVYAAGSAAGVIAGTKGAGEKNGFLARLDDAGDVAWLKNFNTVGGTLSVTGLAVDQTGISALDALGLPQGLLPAADSTKLVDRSALRAGDEFTIAVNEGSARRIVVSATDTLATFAAKIDSALGSAGSARVERNGTFERIVIDMRRGDAATLNAGAASKDALAGLGLREGIISIRPTPESPGAVGEIRAFGLGFTESGLKVDTPAAIKNARAQISAALSILRQAYDALADPAKLDMTPEELEKQQRSSSGEVPEYLQLQLANYQAALLRLTGSAG